MAVSLSKGQKVDLTKTNPGLKKIVIGLGWDTNKYDGGQDFDLDASAFVVGATGKVKDEKDFVFYNNPKGAQGAVVHTGDNRSGGSHDRGGSLGSDCRDYRGTLTFGVHLVRLAIDFSKHRVAVNVFNRNVVDFSFDFNFDDHALRPLLICRATCCARPAASQLLPV